MTTPQEIKARVTEIIRDVLDDQSIALTRETTADDVADWDSLAHINIVVAIEKEFGIKFQMADLKLIKNVGDLLDLVQQKEGDCAERVEAELGFA